MAFFIIQGCKQNEQSSETIMTDDGWIRLLDEDLTQWDQVGEINAEVLDGTLALSAKNDNTTAKLITLEEYDNFHLSMEVKSPDYKSFILFRFNDKLRSVESKAGYVSFLETSEDMRYPSGTILDVARSTIPENYQSDEWNTVEVEAIKDLLKITINGELVALAHNKQFGAGKIALTVPSAADQQVFYRNLKIQKLTTTQEITELLENKYRNDTTVSWKSLFDGKGLSGWNATGDGNWEVQEGVIHGYSGVEGGFLVSEEVYRNFYLKTKFKIIKDDNSGIFIRKSPDSTSVTTTDAIECNIYDYNGPSHAYSTGSIATHARAWFGMIDYQEWNEMEIFAHDDHIVLFVNGRKSSESYLPSNFNKAGNICLQGGIKVFSEDKGPSDIYFKDIMIKSFD